MVFLLMGSMLAYILPDVYKYELCNSSTILRYQLLRLVQLYALFHGQPTHFGLQ